MIHVQCVPTIFFKDSLCKFKKCVLLLMKISGSRSGSFKYLWTNKNDKVLFDYMLQLVQFSRWHANNDTFRPGFLTNMLRMMHEKLPGSNIQPRCSEFGWNARMH